MKKIKPNGSIGRPSKNQQLIIQNKLRLFFDRGYTATLTAEKTHTNIKTVCKYFEEWAEKISEIEDEEFLARQKKEKERVIIAFDHLIFHGYTLLENTKQELAKYESEKKSVPKGLLSLNLEAIKQISNLLERKYSISMQPSFDDAIQEKIEQMIGNAKSRTNY